MTCWGARSGLAGWGLLGTARFASGWPGSPGRSTAWSSHAHKFTYRLHTNAYTLHLSTTHCTRYRDSFAFPLQNTLTLTRTYHLIFYVGLSKDVIHLYYFPYVYGHKWNNKSSILSLFWINSRCVRCLIYTSENWPIKMKHEVDRT